MQAKYDLSESEKALLTSNLSHVGANIYIADEEGASQINTLTTEGKCSFAMHIVCTERNLEDLPNQRSFIIKDSTHQVLHALELNKLFAELRAKNTEGPVVFSCAAGISRSPALAIAYQLYLLQQEQSEMFQQQDANLLVDWIATEVQALRAQVNINHFSRQLVIYAESLKNALGASSSVKPDEAGLPPDTYFDRLSSLFKQERSAVKALNDTENTKYPTITLKKALKKGNAADWIMDPEVTEEYYPKTCFFAKKAGFLPGIDFDSLKLETEERLTMNRVL